MTKKTKLISAFILVLFLFLAGGWILYGLFGHQLIESMYEGKSIGFLNRIIKRQAFNPVEHYFRRIDQVFLSTIILSFFSLPGIFLLYKEWRQGLCLMRKLLVYSKQFYGRYKKIVFAAIVLSVLFFSLYFNIGTIISKIAGYNEYKNIFFGADHLEPIRGWISFHKGIHPILLLFVVPLTNFFKIFISSELFPVLIVNSFFGALGVFLAFFFFRLLSKKNVESFLLTGIYGLCASQLVFSSVPESYSLSACSIILTYILFLVCLQRKKIFIGLWFLVGILTFGIVVTNFVQTLICFTIIIFVVEREKKKKIIIIIQYISAVMLMVLIFNICQIIFLGGQLFIDPGVYMLETKYIKSLILSQPDLAFKEIFKNFFLINLIAPFPNIVDDVSRNFSYLSFYKAPLNYTFFGLGGIFIWVYLIVRRIFKRNFLSYERLFFLGVSFCIFFNMILHMFYETREAFLFSCNFTFPVLLLIVPFKSKNGVFLKVILVLFIILVGANNLIIVKWISTYFSAYF